jgi:hypothetical protein
VPLGLLVYLAVCISAGYAFGKMPFRLRLPLFLVVLGAQKQRVCVSP